MSVGCSLPNPQPPSRFWAMMAPAHLPDLKQQQPEAQSASLAPAPEIYSLPAPFPPPFPAPISLPFTVPFPAPFQVAFMAVDARPATGVEVVAGAWPRSLRAAS